ncbi:hypothetical protein PMAYCL1PPCAC_32729, partial [Pristionchus mayeri]
TSSCSMTTSLDKSSARRTCLAMPALLTRKSRPLLPTMAETWDSASAIDWSQTTSNWMRCSFELLIALRSLALSMFLAVAITMFTD